MKIYEEEEILQEIGRRSDGRQSWVLILVRKETDQEFSFVYYASDWLKRLEDLMYTIPIALQDGGLMLEKQVVPMSEDNQSTTTEQSTGNEEEEECKFFESYFVAKALFSILDGDTLMTIGSSGWMLAVQEKFLYLQAQVQKGKDLLEAGQRMKKKTAAQAAAAAVVGGGVAGSVPAAMGYTGAGIAANSMAATIMGWEAVAGGGSVAAGGFTATMQSVGALGVMATPVGWGLVAGGAVLSGSVYWATKKRREARRRQQQQEAQLLDDSPYTMLGNGKWTFLSVAAKDTDAKTDEPGYHFVHKSWKRPQPAEFFFDAASETSAKALFNPQGEMARSHTADTDVDGWETALTIRYHSLFLS